MRPVTGPKVISWVVHHAGTDRVQLNVTLTCEQVLSILDDAGLEPAFIQRARTAASKIEITNVVPTKVLHGPENTRPIRRCHEQVDMIGHEHPGMDADVELDRGLP